MNSHFEQENVQLYQKALRFAAWSEPLLERLTKSDPLCTRLAVAVASVLRNVYQGKNQAPASDRADFFELARISILESGECLDALAADKLFSDLELEEGKARLRQLLSLLVGLIHTNPPSFGPEESDGRSLRRTNPAKNRAISD